MSRALLHQGEGWSYLPASGKVLGFVKEISYLQAFVLKT